MKLLPFLSLSLALLAGASAQTEPPKTAEAADGLKVMSFNIRNSGAKDGENQWSNRKDQFLSTIGTFAPDLLGLQEVLADQHDQMVEALPAYTPVGVARRDGARKGEWSLIFFSTARFEQVESGTFWLSEHPEEIGSRSWDAALERICSWVKLRERATGQVLLYANTHFDHKGPVARLESARLLRERLAALAGGQPAILTGDFNCYEDEEPWRALTAAVAGVNFTWSDSYREVHPARAADEASFHGFKGGVAGSRIDWILHTGHYQAKAAEIVRTSEAGRYPSDHFAVTATLTLRPAPAAAP